VLYLYLQAIRGQILLIHAGFIRIRFMSGV
jgi:hypothetical protein